MTLLTWSRRCSDLSDAVNLHRSLNSFDTCVLQRSQQIRLSHALQVASVVAGPATSRMLPMKNMTPGCLIKLLNLLCVSKMKRTVEFTFDKQVMV